MATVLIVDDNPDNLYVMLQMLKLYGFEVVGAEDGLKALRAIEQQVPDLILMDLAMPEMDGWSTTAYLKQNPRYAHIPVIAVTSHVTPEHRQRALAAGCEDYIAKPIDFDLLVQKLRSYLPE